MKRRIRCFMILTFVLVLVINCSGFQGLTVFASEADQETEQEEIAGTIDVMGNLSEDIMKKYIEGFEQKYPEVTVKYHYFSNYEEEMQKRFDAGDYGDVLMVPGFLQSSTYSRYLEVLGDYSALSEKYLYLENYKTAGNQVYALPSSAYITGIAYNSDVFYKAGITEVPKTAEEFMEALEAIEQRTDAIPFYTNYSDDWALQPWWEIFPYIEMTGNANYKENEFVDVLNPFQEGKPHYQVYQLLYDIIYNGLAGEKPLETNWEKSKEMLNQGEIGCMAIGSWALIQFKNAGDNGDAIAFMPFPNEIDGKQYMTIVTDYCYGISKNSENKEAARAYVNYMMDESGFALDQDRLSLVKTDPYPEAYGDMENVVLLSNKSSLGQNYNKKKKLSAKLNPDDPAQVKWIMEAAAGERNESFAAIMAEWNGRWESARTWQVETVDEVETTPAVSVVSTSENYEVNYSDTEIQYLNEKGSIKIGYLRNMAPLQFESEEGFAGVAAQICDTIILETGLQAEYYGYDNTEQMLDALDRGEIEMIAGMERNDSYENRVKFSKDYLEYMQVIIKNETVDVDMAQQGIFAAVAGEVTQAGASAEKIIERNTLAEAIKSVEQMEADYTVTNYHSANYYIEQQGFEHIIMLPLSEQGMQYLAFPKNVDTRLVSICNKCIYSIPDVNTQIMLLDYLDPEVEEVTFTRFIEANPFQAMIVMAVILFLILTAVLIVVKEKEQSARKHEFDMQRYQILSALMDEYVYEYDRTEGVLHFDKKVSEQFTFGGDIKVKEYTNEDRQLKFLLEQMHLMEEKPEGSSAPFQMKNKAGEVFWYKLVSYVVNDRNGNPQNVIGKIVCVQQDMEEKRVMKAKAQTDPLTGIYNRDGFAECFDALYQETDAVCPVTFAVLDVDDFKQVNDTLGHRGGDEVLKLLAQNLTGVCPGKSLVARYGGDEFMILIWGTEKAAAEAGFDQLVTAMDQTVTWQGEERRISISLGAVHARQKLSYEELFKLADKVLYQMKKKGKNCFRVEEYKEG